MVLTAAHDFESGATSRQESYATTTIEDGVWIGARSVVLPGVRVGEGCVIAAGAVVAADCAPFGMYGGVPARRLRDLREVAPHAIAYGRAGMSTVVSVRARPIWHSAIPLALWWVGLPLWWAFGIQRAAALLAAIPLAFWLVRRFRQITVPVPFLIFLSFIAWVLLSAFAVTSMRYGASYGMRLAMYVAAFVIGLYVWNALQRGLSPRLLIWFVVSMWAWAVLLTFPGMAQGGLSFTSPVEWLLQHAGIYNDFLRDSSHPQFSEWDQVYGVARPSPLFAYTNEWGAAIGLMTPVAIYAMLTTSRPAAEVRSGRPARDCSHPDHRLPQPGLLDLAVGGRCLCAWSTCAGRQPETAGRRRVDWRRRVGRDRQFLAVHPHRGAVQLFQHEHPVDAL